eukprot:scaffold126503_cov63-Phaeocystis_antarctica.AAC.2
MSHFQKAGGEHPLDLAFVGLIAKSEHPGAGTPSTQVQVPLCSLHVPRAHSDTCCVDNTQHTDDVECCPQMFLTRFCRLWREVGQVKVPPCSLLARAAADPDAKSTDCDAFELHLAVPATGAGPEDKYGYLPAPRAY